MGFIIDRRKINLNTDISVNKYFNRLKCINRKEKIKTLDGYDTAKFISLEEPGFYFDSSTGIYNLITSGNDKWMRDDIISIDDMEEMMSRMRGTSEDDSEEESEDEFTWTDVEKQYLNMLFENLELPNLTKQSTVSEEREIIRAGYSVNGSNVDLMKTFLNATGRRMSLQVPLEKKIKELENENIQKENVETLKKQLKSIPFIDDMDVRYRRYEEQVTLSKRMVMFLLLDISGSMGQKEKNLAKLFAKLVVTFLAKKYDKCEIEYIIFNENAFHVDRQEFYHGKRSGGNMLYTALDLQKEIIEKKYKNDWNIYSMIFSDTGMYGQDKNLSIARIIKLLPLHQYMIYANIHDTYVEELNDLVYNFKSNSAFNYCTIDKDEDIISAFIGLFSKEK